MRRVHVWKKPTTSTDPLWPAVVVRMDAALRTTNGTPISEEYLLKVVDTTAPMLRQIVTRYRKHHLEPGEALRRITRDRFIAYVLVKNMHQD